MAGRIVHPEQSRPSRAAFSWLSIVHNTQRSVPGQAHNQYDKVGQHAMRGLLAALIRVSPPSWP